MELKQFQKMMAEQGAQFNEGEKKIAEQLFNGKNPEYCKGYFEGLEFLIRTFPKVMTDPQNQQISQTISFLFRATATKFKIE